LYLPLDQLVQRRSTASTAEPQVPSAAPPQTSTAPRSRERDSAR
jgi:hypothetical protein